MIIFAKNLLTLPPFTYTGSYILTEIIVNGTAYHLMKISTSGTFTALQERNVDIWLCGGGAGGSRWGGRYVAGDGGGGGEFKQENITLQKLVPVSVIVGQGGFAPATHTFGTGESSSFGTLIARGGGWANAGKQGGSGGGGGGNQSGSSGGIGQRISSVPFLDPINFQPHCAGGGGAGLIGSPYNWSGGHGGSDGSDGTGCTNEGYEHEEFVQYGQGGSPGGGDGGIYDSYRDQIIKVGTNATYWGGGGGGGWYVDGTAGRGYQGIIYLRWPI